MINNKPQPNPHKPGDVDCLAELRNDIKRLKKDEAKLTKIISQAMGDADSLGGNEWIARQTLSTRKGAVDAAALKSDGIDLNDYRKPETVIYQIRLERRAEEAY